MAVLFRAHSDLLTEFTYFLPDNSPPQVCSISSSSSSHKLGSLGLISNRGEIFIYYISISDASVSSTVQVNACSCLCKGSSKCSSAMCPGMWLSSARMWHSMQQWLSQQLCCVVQGGHPLFRNLPGARQNMGAYGRPQAGLGPGGRMITGGQNRGYGAGGR